MLQATWSGKAWRSPRSIQGPLGQVEGRTSQVGIGWLEARGQR
ncbi:hypothetical protein [Streptosporangium roseum]